MSKPTYTLTLTRAELNAIKWAVGNFTIGDWRDCNSRWRFRRMIEVYAKLKALSK